MVKNITFRRVTVNIKCRNSITKKRQSKVGIIEQFKWTHEKENLRKQAIKRNLKKRQNEPKCGKQFIKK